MLVRMWEKKEPSYIADGNVNQYMENSMEAPEKTKNRTAIWSSIITPRDITEGM
jgi:hypothetical protein